MLWMATEKIICQDLKLLNLFSPQFGLLRQLKLSLHHVFIGFQRVAMFWTPHLVPFVHRHFRERAGPQNVSITCQAVYFWNMSWQLFSWGWKFINSGRSLLIGDRQAPWQRFRCVMSSAIFADRLLAIIQAINSWCFCLAYLATTAKMLPTCVTGSSPQPNIRLKFMQTWR